MLIFIPLLFTWMKAWLLQHTALLLFPVILLTELVSIYLMVLVSLLVSLQMVRVVFI